MEAKFGGKTHHLYGPVVPDLKASGKKSLEWDLNDWRWDGDLFTASPLNSIPSDCRSRQLFPAGQETPPSAGLSISSLDEVDPGSEKGKRELEKRRRPVLVDDAELNGEEDGSLNLKLGGEAYSIMELEGELKSGKKTKVVGTTVNRVVCQVEDCRADLSNAKDYHRRHKVCDMHSKASKALVGNVMQRFCQQCSRLAGLCGYFSYRRHSSCHQSFNMVLVNAFFSFLTNLSTMNDGKIREFGLINSLPSV